MASEHLVGTHVPDIVGAIFKRFGRSGREQVTTSERFVLGGRVKHVEIARRTFSLQRNERYYCVSWDDETDFNGIAVSTMHGTDVVVRARANIVGLHAESIAAAGDLEGMREGFSVGTAADYN